MITISTSRQKDGRTFNFTKEVSVTKALESLLQCDLAFGGKVADATQDKLTVVSAVFDAVDTSVYCGSPDELVPLLQAAYFYAKASEDYKEEIFANVSQLQALEAEYERTCPEFMEIGAMLNCSGVIFKAAALCALGITDTHDMHIGLKASFSDIFIAVEMRQAGVCTFAEALRN